MTLRLSLPLLVATLWLAACSRPSEVTPIAAIAASAPSPAASGIAWRHAANDAEVDAAFAQAQASHKPVFVYWGAVWCPPCNQVKATIFNRQDFIERSRAFVPVYIDGDSPGAQKLGARFKVRGYPTMVLFSPAGEELTRLPGEVDAQQYTEVLTLGMNAQRPVKAVLAAARAGGQGLSANDWKLLAFYSWETDEQEQLLPKEQVPAVLKQLAAACPREMADAGTRLFLKAWAASDTKTTPPDAVARERLLAVLRNAEPSRVHMDVLSNYAVELTRAFSTANPAQRQQLVEAFDASLAGLANDVTLSRADRLTALIARAKLAHVDAPKGSGTPPVPPALLSDVREQVTRMDRETTDGYERLVVISTAAELLEEAGVPDESDALLQANLAKSHSPYYLMLGLAANAKRRGDKAVALHWYEEAFAKSEGPATRLQWGAAYVNALVDLSPQDEARIERTAAQLFGEAAAQPNAFYERSARSLQRVGKKLQAWQKTPGHGDAMKRLQVQLKTVCAGVPEADAQRSTCLAVLTA
ncbi:MAG TPA: thioredoxin fold domain-containing protein [Rhizobacter sp.]|nr:thioredoxin fold domain-containing protein [Rhizobacter sp.]